MEKGGGGYIDLPEEVVFQILIYLPVISLLRFKSVCKSWYTLIKSSTFVARHLHHHSTNTSYNDNLMVHASKPSFALNDDNLMVDTSKPIFLMFSGVDKFESSVNLDLSPYLKDDDQMKSFFGSCTSEMVGSCNGIICLMNFNVPDDAWVPIVLWNPAIKQFRALPKSPSPCHHHIHFHLGFGVDVKTNDFKVVRICMSFTSGILVEVYNLSTDAWRTIDNAILSFDTICHTKPVYRNGIYYWMGLNYRRNHQKLFYQSIVTFDFSNEVLGYMLLPEVLNDHQISPTLAFFGENIGCINVVGGSRVHEDVHYEIWVLYEFGVIESWTKLYTLGPFRSYADPCGFSTNEERLLVCTGSHMFLCDPVSQELKRLNIEFCDKKYEALFYKESLVSITRNICS